MGVRGLTTYINRNKIIYFDNYVLPPNSILVLDGESVAISIYHQVRFKNTFFGGDYEIYANAVQEFFMLLFSCQVIPYVVCSGATELRKMSTLLYRMTARLNKIIKLDSSTEVNEPIFPLFIGEVFRDMLKRLKVKMVVCDFEGDLQTASIAKQLDAPVLSFDSDFFIFDVKYIPFSLQENLLPNFIVFQNNRGKSSLSTKIFNREKFLFHTGLTKEMLPVLTMFLGNDFVERAANIPALFQYLNINSTSRDFVTNIITWLRKKKPDEAMQTLKNFYNKDVLVETFNETIKGYTCIESKYLHYLNSEENIIKQDSNEYLHQFPHGFLDKYRCGAYQHNFIEILLRHRYYPKLLVENITKEHSYKKSYQLISILHKILTNSSTADFVVFVRVGSDICEEIVPPYPQKTPTYEQIQTMSQMDRKNLLFNFLQINHKFVDNCLIFFEDSWMILLTTLKYLSTISEVTKPFLHSLVLSKILITYIDSKLGQVRSRAHLYKYYPNPKINCHNGESQTCLQINDVVSKITTDDAALALDRLLPLFVMKNKYKLNNNLFDRNVLHLISEFQATLLHINFLNTLLGLPYEKCHVETFFNGTFIYNLICALQRSGLALIVSELKNSPSIMNCFKFAIDILNKNIST